MDQLLANKTLSKLENLQCMLVTDEYPLLFSPHSGHPTGCIPRYSLMKYAGSDIPSGALEYVLAHFLQVPFQEYSSRFRYEALQSRLSNPLAFAPACSEACTTTCAERAQGSYFILGKAHRTRIGKRSRRAHPIREIVDMIESPWASFLNCKRRKASAHGR